ncbi:MAG: hypothetical protein K9I35_03205 [Flavobacterium sp.]|jgi:hypothetical protein|nr:hypothetical protein [Flavobacterium sp.]
MKAENWTNEILESTNGMMKVLPSKLLFDKIQNRINLENRVSNKWIFIAAASFALLISINISLLKSSSFKSNTQTETVISTISNTNQLY